MASQAYDYVALPRGPIRDLAERWFRFPAWVQTKILAADQTLAAEGDGSLIIDDRIRSDLGCPFRTEDRALLRRDGAFQLKGRVAFSPLKGCSLLAEDILQKSSRTLSSPRPYEPNQQQAAAPVTAERAAELHRLTQFMLGDGEFKALLRRSLGTDRVAQWYLDDLQQSVPASTAQWITAAANAQSSLDSWLFILPRTHDFAVVHPLFMAAALNLRIWLRPALDLHLLHYWQKLFQGFWQFEIIDSGWRLQAGEALPASGLLAFGSDETIAELRAATPVAVQGFGTWITISIIHEVSWAREEWAKDAFSLNQQGCMSSRLLLVWNEDRSLTLPPKTVRLGPLSHGDHLHLAHSELDLALAGYALLPRLALDDLVLGHKAWPGLQGIEDLLSSRPLTLPVIRISRTELRAMLKTIKADDSVKLISCDEPSKALIGASSKIKTCALGQANAAPWNGLHGDRALFFPTGELK